MYVEISIGASENLTSNIIAALQVAREIEARYREPFLSGARSIGPEITLT